MPISRVETMKNRIAAPSGATLHSRKARRILRLLPRSAACRYNDRYVQFVRLDVPKARQSALARVPASRTQILPGFIAAIPHAPTMNEMDC